jgi:hypothetical protein
MPAPGHTGRVSKLVLLPFYPVLERLGIAPCDLDLLLDRFLVHIGHVTLSQPDVGGRGREGRGTARQAIQGPCRERGSPGTEGRLREASDVLAMATEARRAEAIARAQ